MPLQPGIGHRSTFPLVLYENLSSPCSKAVFGSAKLWETFPGQPCHWFLPSLCPLPFINSLSVVNTPAHCSDPRSRVELLSSPAHSPSGSARAASPRVMAFPGWPSSAEWVRQGYEGLAVSVQRGTPLGTTLVPELPAGLAEVSSGLHHISSSSSVQSCFQLLLFIGVDPRQIPHTPDSALASISSEHNRLLWDKGPRLCLSASPQHRPAGLALRRHSANVCRLKPNCC